MTVDSTACSNVISPRKCLTACLYPPVHQTVFHRPSPPPASSPFALLPPTLRKHKVARVRASSLRLLQPLTRAGSSPTLTTAYPFDPPSPSSAAGQRPPASVNAPPAPASAFCVSRCVNPPSRPRVQTPQNPVQTPRSRPFPLPQPPAQILIATRQRRQPL